METNEAFNYNIGLFCRFLKSHNCYGSFILNIERLHERMNPFHLKGDMFYTAILEKSNLLLTPTKFLITAFPWSHTSQGDKFWRTLHTEWVRSYCGRTNGMCFIGEYKNYIVLHKIKEYE